MHSSSFPSSSLGTHVLEAPLRNQRSSVPPFGVSNQASTKTGQITTGGEKVSQHLPPERETQMLQFDAFHSKLGTGAARYNTLLSHDVKKTNNELMAEAQYLNRGHIARLVREKYVLSVGRRGREHEYVINPKKVPQEPVVRPKVNPTAGATDQHNSTSGTAGQEQLAPMCEEVISNHDFTEGKAVQMLVNRFERDEKARRLCLAHFGLSCQCCGFQSRVTYDDSVTVIHVHHKTPLSRIRSEYHPNPTTDLIPLCPNCHAVVHSRNPPLEIDDVRRMLANKRAK